MRKPRGFNHTFIYTDERNEAVRQARMRLQNDGCTERETTSRHLFASNRHYQAHQSAMSMLMGILVPVVLTALILTVVLFLI